MQNDDFENGTLTFLRSPQRQKFSKINNRQLQQKIIKEYSVTRFSKILTSGTDSNSKLTRTFQCLPK
jgi:hypothetical protein